MFSRKERYMSEKFKITLAQLNATVGDLKGNANKVIKACLLYTSDAADE